MPERWYGGFFMTVALHGMNYRYRFRVKGKRYFGLCVNCHTEEEALAFEAQERNRLLAEFYEAEKRSAEYAAQLQIEQEKIKFNRNVRALVENYRYVLNGGKSILLSEAYELFLTKPRKRRTISEKSRKQYQAYWCDFLAFMQNTFPDIDKLEQVMSLHCEAYVSYLISNGRFNSKSDYQLGNKTICEIASSIKGVFRRLKRDAGLLENPWDDVILPAMDDSLRREIFTVDELQKIRCGILHNSFCRPLFTIAAATGLREGDICTLRWKEIDWAGKNIRRVLNKNRKDVSIPIHRMLYDYFLRLHNDDEYVLPEHARIYLSSPTTVSKRIKTFLEDDLGIVTTVQPENRRSISIKDLHSMRHVFCYYAGKVGIPISVVQSIVGHMDERMTAYYQNHVQEETQHQELEKLPSVLLLDAEYAKFAI